jgi:uncharacterized protein YycO
VIYSIKPIYGIDYAPGYSIFTKTDKNAISDGIVWFENLEESAAFGASHVMLVKDEHTVIEATDPKVKETDIKEYFDDPHTLVVCRKPSVLNDTIAQQATQFGMSAIGDPYDFTGLLVGFLLMITTHLDDYFKFLRKWPLPMHLHKSYVCSALVADCYKHTDYYVNIPLFKEWHVSRIFPNKLFDEFPYSLFTHLRTDYLSLKA